MTQNNDGMVMLAIGRLEGKMDMVLSSHKAHTDTLSKHDARIDELDNRVAKMEGKWIIAAAGVTALASIIVWALQNADKLKVLIGG